MASQQKQIELIMRLTAIEFILCKLYSATLKVSGQSDDQISAVLRQVAENAKDQKFPGLNAALSDLASDEYSTAVKKLTDTIEIMARRSSSPP